MRAFGALAAALVLIAGVKAPAYAEPREDFARTRTPLPLSDSLVMHLSANSIRGVSNGSPINSWTAATGGQIFSQRDRANYPTYATNRLNNLPSVEFDGTSQSLCLSSDPGNALANALGFNPTMSYTLAVLFRTLASKTNGTLLASYTAADNSTAGNDIWFRADGNQIGIGLQLFKIPYAGQTSFSTVGTIAFPSGTYSAGKNNSLFQFFINGGVVNSSGHPLGLSTIAPALCIGTTANNHTNGNIEVFDILLWSRPLNPVQLLQFQKWADDKYNQPYPWANETNYVVFQGSSLLTSDCTGGAANEMPPPLAAAKLGLTFGQFQNLGVGGINLTNMNTLALAPSAGGAGWIDPIPAYLGKTVIDATQEWYNSNLGNPFPGPLTEAYNYLRSRKSTANIKTVFLSSTSYAKEPTKLPTNRSKYDEALDNDAPYDIGRYIDSNVSIKNSTGGTYIGALGAASANPAYYCGDGLHLSTLGARVLGDDFYLGIRAVSR